MQKKVVLQKRSALSASKCPGSFFSWLGDIQDFVLSGQEMH